MMEIDWDTLITKAIAARENAYSPYSKFAVGAALLADTEQNEIFTGCNVENLSFGLTICAERNALFSAIATGVRKFQAIAIVADTRVPVAACGACRQVLSEFGDIPILSSNLQGERIVSPLSELLPRSSAGILDQPE